MEETKFVYVNLNAYPAVVNGPYGGPVVVPRNKAVKGEYFARFAQPKGPLHMVPSHLVAPTAIVFEVSPKDEVTASRWEDDKTKADPIMINVVPPSMAPIAAPVVVVEDPVVVGDTVEVEGKEEVVTAVEETVVHVDNPSTEIVEDTPVAKSKVTKKKKQKK